MTGVPDPSLAAAILSPSIHASAVLAGAKAVLIRGPAGAGKSRLAHALIEAAQRGALPIGLLVGDDRVHLEAANGRIVVRPAPALAGLLEIRGVGLLRLPYEVTAVVGLVVDLAYPQAERLPPSSAQVTAIQGISLPLLAIAVGNDPLPLVLIKLRDLASAGAVGETVLPAQVGKK